MPESAKRSRRPLGPTIIPDRVDSAVARTVEMSPAVFALVMSLVMRGRDELEARVAERTAELTRTNEDLTLEIARHRRADEELHKTQAELAHIARVTTLGGLAASLAHEVTQPIAAARNNARAALNFLDRQPSDLGEVREALACVVGDADRAGDIIDRIRDHIRKAPPRKAFFDLNAAINEVIGLARSAIIRNNVSVQAGLADGLFPVQGDRVQLQQVVLNLVLNAIEAMGSIETGARELVISAERTKNVGALVAVRDSGPGIDPDHRERVFQAFYTTKSSGTGMGLSICRSIVDAHGGRLWAEANEPRGPPHRSSRATCAQ